MQPTKGKVRGGGAALKQNCQMKSVSIPLPPPCGLDFRPKVSGVGRRPGPSPGSTTAGFCCSFLVKVQLWLAVCKREVGYFYPIPDSFCAGAKTIAHRASVHTQARLF